MGSLNQLIFTVFLVPLFFIQIDSGRICRNGRGCPDGYECDSPKYGYCCKNGTCDVPNRLSYLKSECLYRWEGKCSDDKYCTEFDGCVSKKISVCDNYLQLIEENKCGIDRLYESFGLCYNIYAQTLNLFEDDVDKEYEAFECGERCFRSQLLNYIMLQSETSCNLYEFINNKTVECYADCGMCFTLEIVKHIFRHLFGYEYRYTVPKIFHIECNRKYLEAIKNGRNLTEVQIMAREFLDKFSPQYYTLRHIFADLMNLKENSTTTVLPTTLTTVLPTTSTTTSFTTKSSPTTISSTTVLPTTSTTVPSSTTSVPSSSSSSTTTLFTTTKSSTTVLSSSSTTTNPTPIGNFPKASISDDDSSFDEISISDSSFDKIPNDDYSSNIEFPFTLTKVDDPFSNTTSDANSTTTPDLFSDIISMTDSNLNTTFTTLAPDSTSNSKLNFDFFEMLFWLLILI